MRLRRCAGLPDSLLLANAISTKISCWLKYIKHQTILGLLQECVFGDRGSFSDKTPMRSIASVSKELRKTNSIISENK